MIRLEDITKTYGTHKVLKDINLVINAQETLVILGPSGSGKTNLLSIISGLQEPTVGNIYYYDTKITKYNTELLRTKLTMVFQHFHLFNNMNVIENITYAAGFRNSNSLELVAKAQSLLQHFELADKATTYPKHLSGGQKQRVAICRALMIDPAIILFDEPTSALDSAKVQDLIKIIQELKDKVAILAVTHHLEFAKAIADRVIRMDNGRIL